MSDSDRPVINCNSQAGNAATQRRNQRPSTLMRILFPCKPRMFRGERWLNIFLRSIHLVGVAGIGGGFLLGLEEGQWTLFWYLALISGVLLSAIYIWSSAIWLFQLKGAAVLAKLILLAAAIGFPTWRPELFISIIVISGFIAHAPGNVRGYRLLMKDSEINGGCKKDAVRPASVGK